MKSEREELLFQFELIFGHPCFYVICARTEDRGVVYRMKRTGPSTEPWGTLYMSCDGDKDELFTEVDWYLFERYDWNHSSATDWMPKRVQVGEENFMVNSVKSGTKIQQKKNRNVVIVQSGETIVYNT